MDDIKDVKRLLFFIFRYNEIGERLKIASVYSLEWHILLVERGVIEDLIRNSCLEYIDELNKICLPKFKELGKHFDKTLFQ